jgi:hypothetical protein
MLRFRSTGSPAPAQDPVLAAWRHRASQAGETGSPEDVRALIDECERRGFSQEDTELDLERLCARLDVLDLDARLSRGELPDIASQHKALGAGRCRFLAPAVWCSAQHDVPGKLFVTDDHVRFVGGAGVTVRWSALARVDIVDRDLLVTMVGNGDGRRFRCNTFSDARVAARLIDHLRGRAGGPASPRSS